MKPDFVWELVPNRYPLNIRLEPRPSDDSASRHTRAITVLAITPEIDQDDDVTYANADGHVQHCNRRYLTRWWIVEDSSEYWDI